MNASNEQQIAEEEVVVRALRAARANDAETGPPRHSQQTDQCPNVARFAAVVKFGGKWTAVEHKHVSGCAFCQKVFGMFAAAIREAARDETVLGLAPGEDTHLGLPMPKPGDDTKRG